MQVYFCAFPIIWQMCIIVHLCASCLGSFLPNLVLCFVFCGLIC